MVGGQPLKSKFPALFNIVHRKQDTVAKVCNSTPLDVSFRRSLVGQNLRDWNQIVSSILDLNLTQDPDTFIWSLNSNGQFSVKSMYAALINNGIRVSQEIWQTKLPTKIKVFMWYLKKGVILTKDNLAKRNWHGDRACSLCHVNESIQHLFLDCAYAKFLWRLVHCVFDLTKPTTIAELFDQWPRHYC